MPVPFVLLLLVSLSFLAHAGRVIIVDPMKSGNDDNCMKTATPILCKSLEKVTKFVESEITIIIKNNVTMNSTFRVVNSTNITLIGDHDSAVLVQIECTAQGKSGFVFEEVNGLNLLNVNICACSLEQKISEFKGTAYHFAMLIKQCTEVYLQNIHFSYSWKTALVLVNNAGRVVVESASFQHNNRDKVTNIGTLYPGALSIIQYHYKVPPNETVNYTITCSTFLNNSVIRTQLKRLPSYDSKGNHIYFENRGYGGAVFILLGKGTTNSTVTVSKSVFSSNKGIRGGGVYAYFSGGASKNVIGISKTNFSQNRAILSGGGVNMGFANFSSRGNTFELRGCNFTSNEASSGAGVTFYSIYNSENSGQRVNITDCRWYKNNGDVSSAVDIAPVFEDQRSWGYLPITEFHNCFFGDNTLHQTQERETSSTHGSKRDFIHHINTGVVGITRFKVRFGGNTTFQYNRYTAVMILSGVMEFLSGSNTTFRANYGYNGGAIAMYGHSSLKLNKDINLRFFVNYAFNRGGAIYHRTYDQRSLLYGTDSVCFFQTNSRKAINSTQVIFTGNGAMVNGAALYADTFQSCASSCSRRFFNYDTSHLTYNSIFKCIGNFTFTLNNRTGKNSLMTGTGNSFNFTSSTVKTACGDMAPNKTCITYAKTKKTQFLCEAIPGDQICLPFIVLDDFGNRVQPMLRTRNMRNNFSVNMSEAYSLTNKFHPLGQPDANVEFRLRVDGIRGIFFYFNVTLLPCPPGYHITTDNPGRCTCALGRNGYKAILKCNDSSFQAQSTGNTWAGYIPEKSTDFRDLYFAPCAFPVCKPASLILLPNRSAELDQLACPGNRQGILCGSCQENYSMLYHSSNFSCKQDKHCSLGPLFYLLSEIVPVVIFFVIVVTFDLSFTSGRAVGFVFFAQHVTTLTVYVEDNIVLSYLQIPYKILYGLFSFEFFDMKQLEFCLWKGAGMLDVIAFKYVTIITAFLLVLSLVLLMRCNCCGKLWQMKRRISAKTSVVHGLSAFLVICYAQCTKISFQILWFVHPIGYNDTLADHQYSYYGGLPYFQGKHLVYAVPALVSVLFVTVIPPLVLLLYPLSLHLLSLCGLSEHWLVNKTLRLTGIHKLMPFIDCFQSCYKDKLRFFAGLYFAYRVVFLLVQNKSHGNIETSIFSGLALVVFWESMLSFTLTRGSSTTCWTLWLCSTLLLSIAAH